MPRLLPIVEGEFSARNSPGAAERRVTPSMMAESEENASQLQSLAFTQAEADGTIEFLSELFMVIFPSPLRYPAQRTLPLHARQ